MLVEVFGKVLAEYRTKSGLTQEKLAEIAGYDRTYISLLERGLRQPTITTIFDISSALGISPSNLIKEVEKIVENS
jgi:transcriptional regulator with XRE-family HTH domain